MNTKLLSEKALSVIDQYLHFRIGNSETCNIPYFNNNHKVVRAGLRATIGKGSPADIFEEVEIELAKRGSHDGELPISLPAGEIKKGTFIPGAISHESLKHFLVDRNIGIDCSGFAYYVLSAESQSRGKSAIDRHLHFPNCRGILGKIRSKMRPAENAGVATLAHDKNSTIIQLSEIQTGDMITMLNTMNNDVKEDRRIRDHIVTVHQVEYQNFIPTVIHYSHSIAWPSDGEYGHGVRQGLIEILDINKPITEQRWTEADKTGIENYTNIRAQKALTELRRLRWF
jgi:hypothetical protein